MSTTIAQFTRMLLASKGALVEPDGEGLSVVSGRELADSLGLAEYQRVVFDPASGDPHALRVDYDAPLLERMGGLVEGLGRMAMAASGPIDLKPIDPKAELDRVLTIANGVYRLRESVVTDAVYVGYVIEYDMLADERTSGLVDVWVNPETRSIAQMTSFIDGLAHDDEGTPRGRAEALVRAAWRLASPAAALALQPRLAEFTDSLTRRRDRDLRRLRDYHLGIDQEIRRKLGRLAAGDEPARQRELTRLEATARSYQARAAELADRSRVRVRLSPLAALVCTLPTYRLKVRLLRRTTSTDTAFTWNPIDRRLETRACDGCNGAATAAMLCDDRAHYLCAECCRPCPHCGRPFCRACHVRCPRRH